MSILGSSLRARAFTFLATAVTIVASLTVPAAPAEAQGLPDLTIPAGATTLNTRVNQPFTIVHFVKNEGAGNARAGVLWRMSLPSGFRITAVTYSGSGGWTCSFNAVVASCFSNFVMPPTNTTRFRVDLDAPSSPGTRQASSKIDVNQAVAESNENNNEFRTTINVAP